MVSRQQLDLAKSMKEMQRMLKQGTGVKQVSGAATHNGDDDDQTDGARSVVSFANESLARSRSRDFEMDDPVA